MAISCMFGFHDWNGCKCDRCGKTRNEGHNWNDDCEKCSKCDATRKDAHKWSDSRCTACGKIDIDDANKQLMNTALSGNIERVRQFLSIGADVNARDNRGITALHIAAQKGFADMVNELLKKGSDVNVAFNGETALHVASAKGHTDIVKALLEKKTNVNVKSNEGMTALGMASQSGHTDVVKALLEKGADVNAKANDSRTALFQASQNGHTEVVKALLEKRSDMNVKANDGATALYAASQEGHAAVVRILLEKGADVNAKDNDSVTSLYMASQNGHTNIVTMLLEKGADVNAKVNDGMTALMVASWKGHADIVKELLKKGADVNAMTAKGFVSALSLASQFGRREIIELLKESPQYVVPEGSIMDSNSQPNTSTVPQPKRALSGEQGSILLYFEDEEQRDAGYIILAGKFRDRFKHVERRNAHNTRGIVHWVILDYESWNSDVLDELERAGFKYGHPMGQSLTLNYSRILTDSYAL
jgi:ankyrin repeat protein